MLKLFILCYFNSKCCFVGNDTKVCFVYLANLSKLINFCSAWNHQKIWRLFLTDIHFFSHFTYYFIMGETWRLKRVPQCETQKPQGFLQGLRFLVNYTRVSLLSTLSLVFLKRSVAINLGILPEHYSWWNRF